VIGLALLPACADDAGQYAPYVPPDRSSLVVGEACRLSAMRRCAIGLLCVDADSGICTTDWSGACERIPERCADVADDDSETVCTCWGRAFESVCHARMAGFGGFLFDSCEAFR
jgi:hypothetical protein